MELQKSQKDMRRVIDFNKKRQLEIFKGQCFNNACVLAKQYGYTLENIFLLAEMLYTEGMRRNWLEIKEVDENGKTERKL